MTYGIKPRILACNDWTTFSVESPFIPLIHPIVLLTVMVSDPCLLGCPLVFITSVQLACGFLSLPPLDVWCTSIYPLRLGLNNSYSRIGFSDLSSQLYVSFPVPPKYWVYTFVTVTATCSPDNLCVQYSINTLSSLQSTSLFFSSLCLQCLGLCDNSEWQRITCSMNGSLHSFYKSEKILMTIMVTLH